MPRTRKKRPTLHRLKLDTPYELHVDVSRANQFIATVTPGGNIISSRRDWVKGSGNRLFQGVGNPSIGMRELYSDQWYANWPGVINCAFVRVKDPSITDPYQVSVKFTVELPTEVEGATSTVSLTIHNMQSVHFTKHLTQCAIRFLIKDGKLVYQLERESYMFLGTDTPFPKGRSITSL